MTSPHTEEQRQLIEEGKAYLARLHDIDISTSKLGAEVLYNMVCLGIEAIFTGVLLKHDCIIDHSNIFRLLRELDKREDVPMYDPWMKTAKLMARFQSYCSLEVVKIKIPNESELKEMFDFGFGVEKYAKSLENSLF